MAVFIARRLVISVLVLLAATFVVYTLTALSGDPLADLREDQTPQRDQKIAERVERMGLDLPIPVRYLSWLWGLLQGDFGVTRTGQEVSGLLSQAVSATLQLVTAAAILGLVIGVLIGIVSALRQYSGFDYSVTFGSFVFFSLPVFVVSTILKQYAAIDFNTWLVDPRISPPVIVVIAVVSGLAWGAIIGGHWRRRLAAFAGAAASTGLILAVLSATRWFADPRLGFGVIMVASLAAAVAFTALLAGIGSRGALYAALATAALGSLLSLELDSVLADPSWLTIAGLAAMSIAISAGIGFALGDQDRRPAITVAVLTGLFTGGVIFIDHFLRAFGGYSDRLSGRPISTIGSRSPNFEGNFWETTWDAVGHVALPTAALVLISLATYSRFTRSSMLEVLNQDYVRTARSKGLTERTVVVRHAYRNALIPITTLAAFDFAGIIGGAIITENVFGWQGMGQLFADGLREVDPPRVMAFFVVTGTAVVVFNMLADIAYAYLDPRIRLS